jgi:hypothetical protein
MKKMLILSTFSPYSTIERGHYYSYFDGFISRFQPQAASAPSGTIALPQSSGATALLAAISAAR